MLEIRLVTFFLQGSHLSLKVLKSPKIGKSALIILKGPKNDIISLYFATLCVVVKF